MQGFNSTANTNVQGPNPKLITIMLIVSKENGTFAKLQIEHSQNFKPKLSVWFFSLMCKVQIAFAYANKTSKFGTLNVSGMIYSSDKVTTHFPYICIGGS